jgi:membrane-associated phospholipid phosphatase
VIPRLQETPNRSILLVWTGVYLTLSLALVMLYRQNALEPLDRFAFAVAEAIHTPWLTALMSMVTHMGGKEVLAPLGGLLVIWFLFKGCRMEAFIVAVTLLVGDLLNDWIKEWFARPRPSLGWGLAEPPDSFSFPSGHAMVGLAFYGMLAHFLQNIFADSPWVRYTPPVTVLLVALISASRVYLGVHYLSDVLAGLAMSAVWYCAIRYVYLFAVQRWRARPGRPLTPWR